MRWSIVATDEDDDDSVAGISDAKNAVDGIDDTNLARANEHLWGWQYTICFCHLSIMTLHKPVKVIHHYNYSIAAAVFEQSVGDLAHVIWHLFGQQRRQQ
jgi:hypothetical protein